MASFEFFKRKAQSAADTAAAIAQDVAAAASEKAGALRDYASEKAALAAEKRQLAENCRALGEWYAAQCGEQPPEAVADIVQAIRRAQEKLAAAEK